MTEYKEYRPSILLSNYVRFFYHFKSDNQIFERIVPDSTTEICIRLGTDSRAYLSNNLTQPKFAAPADLSEVIGISFYPWASSLLLGMPCSEFVDQKVLLAHLAPGIAKLLEDQVHKPRPIKERISGIEKVLIKKLLPHPFDDVVLRSATTIDQHNGNVNIKELVRLSNLTARRFEQRFKEHIGTSPKSYARLKRFRFALSSLRTGRRLTEICYHANYFDQSHFIRDFKSFAGITPKRYMQEQHLLDNINLLSGR